VHKATYLISKLTAWTQVEAISAPVAQIGVNFIVWLNSVVIFHKYMTESFMMKFHFIFCVTQTRFIIFMNFNHPLTLHSINNIT